jgi:predicted outer membrane repeat protein
MSLLTFLTSVALIFKAVSQQIIFQHCSAISRSHRDSGDGEEIKEVKGLIMNSAIVCLSLILSVLAMDCEPPYECSAEALNRELVADTSTVDSPAVMYVTSSQSAAQDSTGSTFNSLSEAWASLTQSYTVIYLLAGTHHLEGSADASTNLQEATIKTLLCSQLQHAECSDAPVTLKLIDFSFKIAVTKLTLTLQDLVFDARTSLVEGCSAEYCFYCPYQSTNSTGTHSDKGTLLTEYARTSVCAAYASQPFISVTQGGTLIVSNVEFNHFRYGLKHLIYSSTSAVSLLNVTFYNSKCSGYIVAIEYGPSYTHKGGRVEFTNNGYLPNTLNLFGYLSAKNVGSIDISGLEVSYGVFMTSVADSFIRLDDCLDVTIQHCTFMYLLNFNGLIKISSTQLDSSPIPTADILVSDLTCSYIWLTAGHLLCIALSSSQLNTVITNVAVTEFYSLGPLMQFFINTLDVDQSTSKAFELSNITLENCRQGDSLIDIDGFSNVNVSTINIRQCGDSFNVAMLNRETMEAFARKQHYVTSFDASSFPVSGLITADNVHNLSITGLTIDSCTFQSNAMPVYLKALTGAVEFSCLVLQDIDFYSAFAFYLETAGAVTFKSSKIDSNSNLDLAKGGVFFVQASEIRIVDCVVSGNSAYDALVSLSAASISITSAHIINNAPKYGGTVKALMVGQSTFTFEDSELSGNTASISSPGLKIQSFSLEPCKVVITRSVFANNSGHSYSFLIFTDSYLQLSQDSSIAYVTFKGNSMPRAVLIMLSHISGRLTLQNLEFVNNQAEEGNLIYCVVQTTEDNQAGIILQDVEAVHNRAIFFLIAKSTIVALKLTTANLRLIDNTMSIASIENAEWTDSKSRFERLTSPFLNPLVQIARSTGVHWTETYLSDANSIYNGAALSISLYSQVRLDNCQLINNHSNLSGGAINIEGQSKLQVHSTLFQGNSAEVYGGAISAQGIQPSEVSNCTFIANSGLGFSGILVSFGVLDISNSTFTHETAYQALVLGFMSTNGSISNCIFKDLSANYGPIILGLSWSNLTLTDVSFVNCSSIYTLIDLTTSNIVLTRVRSVGNTSITEVSLINFS